MLIAFATDHGNLVIRSEDLRRLEDKQCSVTIEGGTAEIECVVVWVETENELAPQHRSVHGTAAENTVRIVQQEAQVLATYEEVQRQARYTRRGEVKR